MAERLLSTWQAAELLGITQSAVIGWIEKGRLPFKRLDNGAVRIREEGLLQLIARRSGASREPSDATSEPAEIEPPDEPPPAPAAEDEDLQPAPPEPDGADRAAPDEAPDAPPFDEGGDRAARSPDRQAPSAPEAGPTTSDDRSLRRDASAPDETVDPTAVVWPNAPPSPSAQVLAALVQDALARGASHAHLARVNGEVRLSLRIDGRLCRRRGMGARVSGDLADELFARLRDLAGEDAADGPARPFDVHLADTARGEEATLAVRQPAADVEDVLSADGLESSRGLLADGRGMLCIVGACRRHRRSLLHALSAQTGDALSVWDELTDPGRCARATREAADRAVAVTLPTDSIPDALDMLTDAAGAGRAAGALRGVAAPFVVRRLCASCAGRAGPDPALIGRVGIRPEDLEDAVPAPVGCERCAWTGYRGRGMLVALVDVDEALRSLLRRGQSLGASMLSESRRRVSTRREGLAAVRAGLTTLGELLRAAGRAIED